MMTERLVSALREALHRHPEQRLGQLLINALSMGGADEDMMWNTYDEQWLELLGR